MKKLTTRALLPLLFLCTGPALAGGDEAVYSDSTNGFASEYIDNTTDVSNTYNSGSPVTFDTYTPSSETSYSFSDSPSLDIRPLESLRNNSFNYSSQTSFSGSFDGYGRSNNQCGVSLYGNVNNANTALEETVELGFILNSKKCLDEQKALEQKLALEEKALEAQLNLGKINAQVSTINNCVDERSRAVAQGKDPNLICKVPNLSDLELRF